MLLATRLLTLEDDGTTAEVLVRLFTPVAAKGDWSCRYEIAWPGDTRKSSAVGIDAMQAIDLALKKIGAELYTSDPHKAGRLFWREPGKGYGFPVPSTLRDLLVGEDREL